MKTMTYLMESVDFGADLIRTGDLDPVYIALNQLDMPAPKLARWCLFYWMFYHAGSASKASEMGKARYWDYMEWYARNSGPLAPRASERRHCRGDAALRAVFDLRSKFNGDPTKIVAYWARPDLGTPTFDHVRQCVSEQYLFGPWIVFKVADMLERVWGYPIDFSGCHLDMYREPTEGASLVYHGDPKLTASNGDIVTVVHEIRKRLRAKALRPPGAPHRRMVGLQEVETVLCKFKGHWKGHYAVGHDIKAIRAAADPASWGRTAGAFQDAMPAIVDNPKRYARKETA